MTDQDQKQPRSECARATGMSYANLATWKPAPGLVLGLFRIAY